tara:strand:+ start:78658 stop:79302 length:645 start_codon:yes stop_codon:yes gene_type:complete
LRKKNIYKTILYLLKLISNKLSFTFLFIIIISIANANGGFDNGTATGKNKFQIDITYNPFGKISFGQSYSVISYGFTDYLDFHGYISNHQEGFNSWYGGIFYQFLNHEKIHLATAVGIRGRFDLSNFQHIFLPQLLYTVLITDRISIGGSFVNVYDKPEEYNYGFAKDISISYKLRYKNKSIENVSLTVGLFNPVTWEPKSNFVPTYSIDIKFN